MCKALWYSGLQENDIFSGVILMDKSVLWFVTANYSNIKMILQKSKNTKCYTWQQVSSMPLACFPMKTYQIFKTNLDI